MKLHFSLGGLFPQLGKQEQAEYQLPSVLGVETGTASWLEPGPLPRHLSANFPGPGFSQW